MQSKYTIPFNKIFLGDNSTNYLQHVIQNKALGQRQYIEQCESFFQDRYGYVNALLTPTCTDALEMAALLIDVQEGDEIILASYGYVSTANAFILRGAKLIFIDSSIQNPNIAAASVEEQITPRTKAIVITHYGGIACEMEQLIAIAKKHNVFLIEDAAHSVDAFYKNSALGSFGDIATFSFDHTKNISCGQGGMIVINNKSLHNRAEILRERGTNRTAFLNGLADRYTWHNVGSAYRLSELSAALLYAQLMNIDAVQKKRMEVWNFYWDHLSSLHKKGLLILPTLNSPIKHNAHIFFFCLPIPSERSKFIAYMTECGIQCVSHYISLHTSPFYRNKHDGRALKQADFYTEYLIRLPIYPELTLSEAKFVVDSISSFFVQNHTVLRIERREQRIERKNVRNETKFH